MRTGQQGVFPLHLTFRVATSYRRALLAHFEAEASRSDREEIDQRFDEISAVFARAAADGPEPSPWLLDLAQQLYDDLEKQQIEDKRRMDRVSEGKIASGTELRRE